MTLPPEAAASESMAYSQLSPSWYPPPWIQIMTGSAPGP